MNRLVAATRDMPLPVAASTTCIRRPRMPGVARAPLVQNPTKYRNWIATEMSVTRISSGVTVITNEVWAAGVPTSAASMACRIMPV